ncbi:hypothetical protein [Microbacterium sp.]|uniref:hypothetical protein n=1 Tax=Microbacterium sp. TaxID=51671 RepID=UPI003A91D632
MSTWYSVEDEAAQTRVAGAWPDVPLIDLEVCAMILSVAQQQVLAYAPAPGENDDFDLAPPDRFVYAQVEQAKNLWNKRRSAGDETIGVEPFSFTPQMDYGIQQIIRPKDGRPDVY